MPSKLKVTNIDEWLRCRKAAKGGDYTHTKIGDKALNIYAGTYNISELDQISFQKKYFKAAFKDGVKQYLTEKQRIENGPIMIDIDLRYATTIKEKQHTDDHILDFIMAYLEKCNDVINVTENASVDVFVMEKKKVNCLPEKTKDGIHIIIGITLHKGLQTLLRDKMLEDLPDMWDDLPITNTWDEVFDEGVTKGHVNWQLYGSMKPNHSPYLIKKHFTVKYDGVNWYPEENDMKSFDTEKMLPKLSARYTDYPAFEMVEEIQDEFESACQTLGRKHKNGMKNAKTKYNLTMRSAVSNMSIMDIKNEDLLDQLLEEMLDNISPSDYHIKETHDYTMTLPKEYYGPGSYNKWIRTGWALSTTSHKLFLTWLKFSSREVCRDTLKGGNGKFDWKNVGMLYEMWNSFDSGHRIDGLTHRSIMYWSKLSVPEKFNEVYRETIEYFINVTIGSRGGGSEKNGDNPTEFDLAQVLYQMYKDKYVCVSIKNNCWFQYKNHRWYEIDQGTSLRMNISTHMWRQYFDRLQPFVNKMAQEEDDDERKNLTMIAYKYGNICEILKKTVWKNNIMREARELFYDQYFML